MIRVEPAKGGKAKVTFSLPVDEPAGKVAVAGDFNDWDESGTTLRKRGEVRQTSLTLEAGRRYRFRYRTADGEWFNDEAAHAYEPNDFGADDCIIDLTDSAQQTLD